MTRIITTELHSTQLKKIYLLLKVAKLILTYIQIKEKARSLS